MKKTLLIALAGMMLFAFTQCGGGKAKGSKEYQDTKALIEELETAVKGANSCDELQETAMDMLIITLVPQNYTDEEKMTESEKAEIEKLGKKLDEVMESKAKKLGCEDE